MAWSRRFVTKKVRPVAYSNLGFAVLSAVIEKIEADDFNSVLQRRICGPLGLTNTYVPTTVEPARRELQGHDSFGLPVPKWTGATGAGGIRSSISDLGRFLQAHISPGASPLCEALKLVTGRLNHVNTAAPLGWIQQGTRDRPVLWHNGSSGGFGAFVAIDLTEERGVAILVDAKLSRAVEDAGFRLLFPH